MCRRPSAASSPSPAQDQCAVARRRRCRHRGDRAVRHPPVPGSLFDPAGEAARGEQEQGREDEGGQRQVPAQPEGGGGMEDGGERGRDRGSPRRCCWKKCDGRSWTWRKAAARNRSTNLSVVQAARELPRQPTSAASAAAPSQAPAGPQKAECEPAFRAWSVSSANKRIAAVSASAETTTQAVITPSHLRSPRVSGQNRRKACRASPSIDGSFPQLWTDALPACPRRGHLCDHAITGDPARRRPRGEPVERHGDSPFPVTRVGEFQRGKHYGIRRPEKGNSGETSIKDRCA